MLDIFYKVTWKSLLTFIKIPCQIERTLSSQTEQNQSRHREGEARPIPAAFSVQSLAR